MLPTVDNRVESSGRGTATERIYGIDAFRGFTMIAMLSEGLALSHVAMYPLMGLLAVQLDHAEWNGMHAWDMIQPFFMFIVGLVMPVSFARRWRRGETWGQSLAHVLRRCALLILFGLVARSIQAGRPVIDLINVLAQVAFTYFVAFLVLRKSWQVQGIVALAMLAAHWAIYQFVSAPGVQGPWVQDANIGWYLDRAILGKNWHGSYATINCISSAANTIFGVMAGALLTGSRPVRKKLSILATAGVLAIVAGFALSPAIPINKKIWTASFALVSTGITLFALLFFYWICDLMQKRKWATIFVVVGSNSIFIYVLHEIAGRWLDRSAGVFTGWTAQWLGPWTDVLTVTVALAFQIWLCWWLWQRKIFFKL